jgi:hypothetical protein
MKALHFILVFCLFLAMACTGQDETGGGGEQPGEEVPSEMILGGETLALLDSAEIEQEKTPLDEITGDSCGVAGGTVLLCDLKQFSTALLRKANSMLKNPKPRATGVYYVKKGTDVNVEKLNDFLKNHKRVFGEDEIGLVLLYTGNEGGGLTKAETADDGAISKTLWFSVVEGGEGTCGKVTAEYMFKLTKIPPDVKVELEFDEDVPWCAESYQELRWQFDLFEAVTAVKLTGNRVYAGTRDGYVYAFDSEGNALWSRQVCVEAVPKVDETGEVEPGYVGRSVTSLSASESKIPVGCDNDMMHVLDVDGNERYGVKLP